MSDSDAALPLVARPSVRLRRGAQRIAPLLGPALVACIAYVDPGNFATNIQGGAEHGFLLLWVIAVADAMAMVVLISLSRGARSVAIHEELTPPHPGHARELASLRRSSPEKTRHATRAR